jgi:hypothetical protein
MKTLRARDVRTIPARQVEPGHVLAEGIVIDTEHADGYVYLTTILGDLAQSYTDPIQVYARVGDIELDAIREAVNEAKGRRTVS